MFLAGDEFMNSQDGNNNAYCQDNELSWVNWNSFQKNQEVFTFFQQVIQFRKLHPVLRKEIAPSSLGFPSVSMHGV